MVVLQVALILCFANVALAEWLQRTFSSPLSTSSYLGVSWPDNSTVIAVGGQTSGIFIRSVDYGVSWSQVGASLSPTQMYGVASMEVSGTTYSIAVDDAAEVFLSSDLGLTWSLITQFSGALYGATIGSNGNAFVCGGTATQVYRSSQASGYATWTTVSPSTSGTLYGISSYDGTNVIAVGSVSGQGKIFYSSNSGTSGSWSLSTTMNLPTTGTIVYCVDHGSSTFAMAAGLNSYVAKTSDGGATWTRMTVFSGTVTIRYQAISVLGTQSAYVAGANGQIYRTVDGGSSWNMVASTGSTLTSLAMKDFIHGVAGAIAGKGVYALVPSKLCASPFTLCSLLLAAFSRSYVTADKPAFRPAFFAALSTSYRSTHQAADNTTDVAAIETAYCSAVDSTNVEAYWPAFSDSYVSAFAAT